jgi:hypothetical protein
MKCPPIGLEFLVAGVVIGLFRPLWETANKQSGKKGREEHDSKSHAKALTIALRGLLPLPIEML